MMAVFEIWAVQALQGTMLKLSHVPGNISKHENMKNYVKNKIAILENSSVDLEKAWMFQ